MADDPNWPRASAWLRRTHGATAGPLAVLGVPLRLGSITPGRCDLAPHAIRVALTRYSTYDFGSGLDLQALDAVDLGDLPVAGASLEEAFAPVSSVVRDTLATHETLVLLGGDNGVTRPGVHGLGVPLERCGLLTIDAHLDLRSLDEGLSNGNPVRALLADGLPGRQIAQVGLQSFANSGAYARVARDAGIRVVTVEDVRETSISRVIVEALDALSGCEAIYVDLDLDAMDRISAPGTPGSRPGGLTPGELRQAAMICGRHPKVRAMDLVELDPAKDIAEATILTAAACLLSFASGVQQRLAAQA
jgi:formiminoglutamase